MVDGQTKNIISVHRKPVNAENNVYRACNNQLKNLLHITHIAYLNEQIPDESRNEILR